MSDVYDPPSRVKVDSHVSSMEDYKALYQESVDNPGKFWGSIANQFHWQTPPNTDENFLKFNFDINKGPIKVEVAPESVTNICYNCLDRHLEKHGSQVYYSDFPFISNSSNNIVISFRLHFIGKEMI